MESKIIYMATKLMKMSEDKLCDNCLGRNFSKDLDGPDNIHRGKYIRQMLNQNDINASNNDQCYICSDLFKNMDKFVQEIIDKIATENIEFNTFLVGCRVPQEMLKKEAEIHQKMGIDVENIKKEINREIGKKLELRLQREVDFEDPDIVIMLDLLNNNIYIQINPVFIEGRYRKLIRGIPQTKWPCRKCKGKGCPSCDNTGKQYLESIEELISPPALQMFAGSTSKFHGAGREDIDVRMLGKGRPFVLEIKEPHVRNMDLKLLHEKINQSSLGKVEVSNFKFVGRERKGRIKSSSTETYKVYRALIEVEDEIKEPQLNLLQSLKIIKQRTPLRVSHRRADKIRTREVKKIGAELIDTHKFEIIIECQGGLYIKELISGDEGRSIPSISEVLDTNAVCIQLDVLEVNI